MVYAFVEASIISAHFYNNYLKAQLLVKNYITNDFAKNSQICSLSLIQAI